MACFFHFYLSDSFLVSYYRRNAESWLIEQRRRLRWLRAKSIEVGIYNPDNNFLEKMLFAEEHAKQNGPKASPGSPTKKNSAKSD